MEKRKVLVVCDSGDRRAFIEYHLRQNKFWPIWYPNILSAGYALRNEQFSMVIVDLELPLEPKLKLIRDSLSLSPHVPVLSIGKTEYLERERPLPISPSLENLTSIETLPKLLGGKRGTTG